MIPVTIIPLQKASLEVIANIPSSSADERIQKFVHGSEGNSSRSSSPPRYLDSNADSLYSISEIGETEIKESSLFFERTEGYSLSQQIKEFLAESNKNKYTFGHFLNMMGESSSEPSNQEVQDDSTSEASDLGSERSTTSDEELKRPSKRVRCE